MENVDQGYYESAPRVEDKPSLYAAMHRSRDYGDKRIFPNPVEIWQTGGYWRDQLENPELSARAKKDIGLLVVRATVEIVMQQKDMVRDVEAFLAEEAGDE